MTVTWIFCGLYLWDAMFHSYRITVFQSKKETDADENLNRVNHFWEKLPAWMREWAPANKTFCRIEFPRNNSRFFGIPSGAHHVRQFQPSSYFLDEAVYVDDVHGVVTALRPALKKGGRFTVVSSAGPSYFGNMVLDRT